MSLIHAFPRQVVFFEPTPIEGNEEMGAAVSVGYGQFGFGHLLPSCTWGLIAGAQSTFDRLLDRLCDCHLVNGCLRKAVKLMAIRLCGRENPKFLQSQWKL